MHRQMYMCVQSVCVFCMITSICRHSVITLQINTLIRMCLWFREKPHIVTLIYGSVFMGLSMHIMVYLSFVFSIKN